MPVWDFDLEAEQHETDPIDLTKDARYEEDADLEWMLGQLFADWVPFYQSFPISKPLPRIYSEEDMPAPNGYDEILQTDHITATNVDQFALSIRDTKEWRSKKLMPMWADAMDVNPGMLLQLVDHNKQAGRDGSQSTVKKTNGSQQKDARRHDGKQKAANVESRGKSSHAQLSPNNATASTIVVPTSDGSSARRGDIGGIKENDQKRRRRSSPKIQPETELPSFFSLNSDGQHENHVQDNDYRQLRASDGQFSERSQPDDEGPVEVSKVQEHEDSLGHDTKVPTVHDSIELDMSKSSSASGNIPKHDIERPSSRGSLRSWHSHRGKISRQASIVSEISHPDSPLTPTEMALLGIEGLDDDDDDNDNDADSGSDNVRRAQVSATPPPPKRHRRDGDTIEMDSSATKTTRTGKRQAAAVEDASPRIKKRRQQVASAFRYVVCVPSKTLERGRGTNESYEQSPMVVDSDTSAIASMCWLCKHRSHRPLSIFFFENSASSTCSILGLGCRAIVRMGLADQLLHL